MSRARPKAIEALRKAKVGDFDAADLLMKESHEAVEAAHKFQTSLLQGDMDEDNPDQVEVSLLMVHGQDHLMNALTVQDLVTELIDMLRQQVAKI